MTTSRSGFTFAFLVLGLMGCSASFGVVGVEPRFGGDSELVIAGPMSGTCLAQRRVVDPVTHAALDERCDGIVSASVR